MQVYCHLGIFGSKSIMVNEPPCAEPHAGWCGGWRVEASGYPIYTFPLFNLDSKSEGAM